MPRKANTGGPQPGSGRPPGHGPERKAAQAISAALSTPQESVPDLDVSGINPGIVTACKMRARGRSINSIAGELGHEWETIQKWTSGPLAAQLIEREIDRMVDPKAAFRQMAPDVLAGYHELINDQENPAVRGMMLKDAADRIWDKPRIISESYSQAAVTVHIISGDSDLGAADFRPSFDLENGPAEVMRGGFAPSPIPSDTESQ